MTAVQKARRREAHKLENVPVTLATSIVVFVFVDLYLSICICVFVLVYFCICFCLYMWICKKTRGHAAGECACHSHLVNISPEILTLAGKWKTIARKNIFAPKRNAFHQIAV